MWKVALCIGMMLAPSTAIAGPGEDADAAIARGIAYRKTHDDAAALGEFLTARSLLSTPKTTAQIGLAFQALGRWPEAAAELEACLRDENDPWIARSLTSVRAHLGSVEVRGSPLGAEVLVDGKRVGAIPMPSPTWVNPGKVVVEVRSPGFLSAERTINVTKDSISRETIELTATAGSSIVRHKTVPPMDDRAGSASSVDGSSPRPPSDARVMAATKDAPAGQDSHARAAWVVGAAGGLLLGTGIAALVVRSDAEAQLSRHLDQSRDCTSIGTAFFGPAAQTCVDLASKRDRWTWVSAGAFVAAGALAVTTVILLANRTDRTGSHASVTPGIAATLGPGLTFASLDWRY
jgi:hypothetical protein